MEDLVSKLLEITHHMWTTRNGVLHEKDSDGLTAEEATQLREDIAEQFLIGGDTLKAEDRHLLENGMEALLHTSAATKQTWLRTIRLAREIAEEDRQNDVSQMQSTLQQWLIVTID